MVLQPAFGFEDVAALALAAQPYRGATEPAEPRLRQLDYDGWRKIRFRDERALWHGDGRNYEVRWCRSKNADE